MCDNIIHHEEQAERYREGIVDSDSAVYMLIGALHELKKAQRTTIGDGLALGIGLICAPLVLGAIIYGVFAFFGGQI